MTYAPVKFKDATSYGVGGDTITRNVTDAQTHGRTDARTTDRLWYEINIRFFSKEKGGYNKLLPIVNAYPQVIINAEMG